MGGVGVGLTATGDIKMMLDGITYFPMTVGQWLRYSMLISSSGFCIHTKKIKTNKETTNNW